MLDPLLRNKEGLNAADVARKYHFTELEDYLLQKVKIDIFNTCWAIDILV